MHTERESDSMDGYLEVIISSFQLCVMYRVKHM